MLIALSSGHVVMLWLCTAVSFTSSHLFWPASSISSRSLSWRDEPRWILNPESWILWVSWGCLLSLSSSLKPFRFGLESLDTTCHAIKHLCALGTRAKPRPVAWWMMQSLNNSKSLPAHFLYFLPYVAKKKSDQKLYRGNEALLRARLLHKQVYVLAYLSASCSVD